MGGETEGGVGLVQFWWASMEEGVGRGELKVYDEKAQR